MNEKDSYRISDYFVFADLDEETALVVSLLIKQFVKMQGNLHRRYQGKLDEQSKRHREAIEKIQQKLTERNQAALKAMAERDAAKRDLRAVTHSCRELRNRLLSLQLEKDMGD